MALAHRRTDQYLPPLPNAERIVTFRATVAADQVMLMLCDANGRGQVLLPMTRTPSTSSWRLSRPLRPGQYRYRYYAARGGQLVYLSPIEARDDSCLIDGTDAILTVDLAEPADGPLDTDAASEVAA